MKVLCWHSSRFLGEALSYSFSREHDFDVMDAVTTPDAALQSLAAHALDVLVVGAVPLSTLQQWQIQVPITKASSVKSLYLGVHLSPLVLQQVMTVGFDGILDADASHSDAADFVRSIYNGTDLTNAPGKSSGEIFSGVALDFVSACEDLVDHKVLAALSVGMTDREIAEHAAITFQNTRNRIGRLLHTLNIQNRTQLAIHYLRYRYLTEGDRALFDGSP
jgi:DNA-binding NarL/FixJ family response regulator